MRGLQVLILGCCIDDDSFEALRNGLGRSRMRSMIIGAFQGTFGQEMVL